MRYEPQDQDFCRASNPGVYVAIENKKETLEICPLCNEANDHYTFNGICDCEVMEIWSNDETKLSFEDYKNLFFKML